MDRQNSTHIIEAAVKLSPYPTSFGGNPWLYAFALSSLLSIAVFGLIIVRWMVRDIWRERYLHHPKSLLFMFRMMVLLISLTAFVRCLPEVVYMTCYGDKKMTPYMGAITMAKRLADTLSLPIVISWMTILVFIYPFVSIALSSGPPREVQIDPLSFWPRLVRPTIILAIVIAIAILMAVSKGARMG